MDTTSDAGRKAGMWVIVWGVLLILAGIFAIFAPGAAAIATVLTLSWLFIFAGIVELIYAFHQRAEDGFAWKVLSGIATLALGIVLLMFPIAGAASLALVIGGFMFVTGIANVLLGFKVKPRNGWGWVAFDGLLSIVIAILIAIGWPAGSIGFIGVLVGVCLISGGFWRIRLGRALRSGAVPAR
jgi:uncharacterized membrane protein HdeD (DUF308 family)